MRAVAKDEVYPSGTGPAAQTLLGHPWLLTTLLASGLCVAYLVGVFVNWGEMADRSLYSNLGMIPIGLAATILALRAYAGRTPGVGAESPPQTTEEVGDGVGGEGRRLANPGCAVAAD